MAVNQQRLPLQQAPQQAPQRNLQQYLRGYLNTISQSIGGITANPLRANSVTGAQLARPSLTPIGYGMFGATGLLDTSGPMQNNIGRVVAYIFGIIIIVLVLSLLVHYYITPVYSLQPGAPGIISVPGFDDGVIFWNGSGKYPAMGLIKNDDLPIKNEYYDYSLIVDLFIQNPLQFSSNPRILFKRGDLSSINKNPTGTEILGVITNYNLVVALKPDTTDMIVSVLTLNKANYSESENVTIENIPVQEPFRLGIVVMQNALEVYINGFLMKTRQIKNALKDVKGDFAPASDTQISIAKMQNLKIWSRALSTPEIREAKPVLASAKSFNALPIPSSTSCGN